MIADVSYSWELQHQWPLPLGVIITLLSVGCLVVAWTLVRERITFGKKLVLGLLRFGTFGIAFLMLGAWSIARFETDLPDLLLLFDTSMSMQLADGAKSKNPPSRLSVAKTIVNDDKFIHRLRERYKVKSFSVGEALTNINTSAAVISALEAAGSESQLGTNLLDALKIQRGRATAAAVLFSDGITTTGAQLEAAAESFSERGIPLWCIGIGGSELPPEYSIADLRFDRRAFLGDQIHIDVVVESTLPAAQNTEIRILDESTGNVLAKRNLSLERSQSRTTIELVVPATQKGRLSLRASVTPATGEIFTQNNSRRFSVAVSDEAMSVLLIGQRPSYEFRFLKHLFERAKGQGRAASPLIQVSSVLQDGDPRYAEQDRTATMLPPVRREELDRLDVVVLCDANVQQLGTLLLRELSDRIQNRGLGLVAIAGPDNFPHSLTGSPLESLLPVNLKNISTPTGPVSEPRTLQQTRTGMNFPAVQMPQTMSWKNVPPVFWLAETDELKPSAQVVIESPKSKSTRLKASPVIVTQLVGVGQVWLQLTDESFRWLNGPADQNLHERYWLQLIRQLAARKRLDLASGLGELTIDGERFIVGEDINVSLKLPERSNATQATAEIKNSEGEVVSELMIPSGEPHTLRGQISGLGEGQYSLRLSDDSLTDFELAHTQPLSFVVNSNSIELKQTAAAFEKMKRASELTGGQLLRPEQARAQLIRKLPKGRRVRLRQLPSISIWNSWIVASLFVAFLSTDWILRRKWGLP